jgi:hypothetical protein
MLITWTRSQLILNKKNSKADLVFELDLDLNGIPEEFENFDLIEGLS